MVGAIREKTIEECASLLEDIASNINDVMIEEMHLINEDTLDCLRSDKEYCRYLAKRIRGLKSKGEEVL